MRDKLSLLLTLIIFLLIGVGVYLNIMQQMAVDRSKLPEKVELANGFQRWISNLKNKSLTISADEFRLQEEVEIYNTKWMSVYSSDNTDEYERYMKTLESLKGVKQVIFSPSERLFIDYRPIIRGPYQPNEVHFYGLRDNKIIDARILDCSKRANCYFDRAYFLDNDVFVVSEVSRNIHKHDETTPICDTSETCTYTFKVHVIDLVNNSRLVYESLPFEAVLDTLIPEL